MARRLADRARLGQSAAMGGEFFPDHPGREPAVAHQAGDVLLLIPISEAGLERRAPKRWLRISGAAIAEAMGAETASRMTDRQKEAFVRNNIERIRARLIERFDARPDARLTDPGSCGLPTYIHVAPGAL